MLYEQTGRGIEEWYFLAYTVYIPVLLQYCVVRVLPYKTTKLLPISRTCSSGSRNLRLHSRVWRQSMILLLQAVWHWAALSREWGRGCLCHPTDYECHDTTQVKLLYFNQSEWCIQPLDRKWKLVVITSCRILVATKASLVVSSYLGCV